METLPLDIQVELAFDAKNLAFRDLFDLQQGWQYTYYQSYEYEKNRGLLFPRFQPFLVPEEREEYEKWKALYLKAEEKFHCLTDTHNSLCGKMYDEK